MANEDFDPFDQSSTPAVSWTTAEDPDVIAPKGTKRYFEVLGKADFVQQRDFDSGEPAFWPTKRPDETPQPKMAAVLNVIERSGPTKDSAVVEHQHKGGEEQAFWAPKGAKGAKGSLFNQIAAAQKAAGGRIDAGTLLAVELVDKIKDESNPSKRAQNIFEAKVALNFFPKREKPVEDDGDPFASGGSTGGSAPADEEPPF